MFGISLWKIFAVLALIGAAVGYFKYTQDELARLNQEVAAKDFALKTTTETLRKKQEDLKVQQEVAQKAYDDYQTARNEVNTIQEKFRKNNRDLAAFAQAKPKEVNDELATYIKPTGKFTGDTFAALAGACDDIRERLQSAETFQALPPAERGDIRTDLFLIAKTIRKLEQQGKLEDIGGIRKNAREMAKHSEELTNFIPDWVKYSVALALGLGTMIGYQRIVRTVGERIGKEHLIS